MPLPQKQPININFHGGIDLKTDDKQVRPGKFVRLVNSVFDKVGRLTKRAGFPRLSALPDSNTSFLTTFNGNLQAIGTELLASAGNTGWADKGSVHPIRVATMPLIRNSLNQIQCDAAVSLVGTVCTVYSESNGSSTVYKYVVAEASTGQNIIAPTLITPSSGTVTNSPRVLLLGNYFVILFGTLISATTHLQYLALSTLTGEVAKVAQDVSTSFTPSTTLAYDAVVTNNSMYIAWNGAAASGIRVAVLNSFLALSTTTIVDGAHVATLMSVTADDSDPGVPIIWLSYYASGTGNAYSMALSTTITPVLAATNTITGGSVLNITATAQDGVLQIAYELANNYGYDSAVPSHILKARSLTQGGSLSSAVVVARSLGLASKGFLATQGGATKAFCLATYQSPYQPTYFLVDLTDSLSSAPIPIAKLAYSNGGGYLVLGLPNVTLDADGAYHIPYLFKDVVQSVNKNTNVPSGSQVAGIYSQTGINLASFTFTTAGLAAAEVGNNLNLSGGFGWAYDGYLPVEQNFFLYPDSVEATTATTGGHLADQIYFYVATYEWTDNQGNAFRSAPSIPITITTTGGNVSTNTVYVPYLRLTYKIANKPKIVLYRWSTAQQSYYQVTSISTPTLNDTTNDYATITDTLADATILGNNLLYTTGGVVENINPPPSDIVTVFDTRLWVLDAEDPNLFWYSKTVVEAAPVEMSDLFTLFINPNIGVQGPTGPVTAAAPMDDKLIIFKESAINYINGTGPDATGANNNYSQPIFITSTVGCSNARSIVMTPAGLMFQSNKGIWLLDHNLVTKYIGAEVEDFNGVDVTSAVAVPGTNQVRFGLADGVTLMYDYYVDQWGMFEGIPSISATIYNDLHTIVDSYGNVSQESPNTYLDGDNPVLMSFKTGWLQLAGLRGYMRAYWLFLLGTYLTPHKLQVEVGYDYENSPQQSYLLAPGNYAGPYGDDPVYGGDGTSSYGGKSLETFRIFLERQRCKAFQLSIQEVFDPSHGTAAGPGLTLSGISAIVGVKKAWAPIDSTHSFG